MEEKGYTILIVDDDKDLSLLISDMLFDNGYGCLLAESLDEAYDIIEKNKVHLILLDINLRFRRFRLYLQAQELQRTIR